MLETVKHRVIEIAKYTTKTGSTVRQTAEVFGIGKTTVHLDLSERLKKLDKGLYSEVKAVLDNNLRERHLRGGKATKNKYKKENLA